MTDMIGVRPGQLAAALDGFRLEVRVHATTGAMGTSQVSGEIADAQEVARALYATLSRMWSEELGKPPVLLPPPDGDPEIRAMQVIADALAPFDREAPGPVERILRWACDRWYVEVPS